MAHIAYPNVIPREGKFLGCARYIAAPYGASPGPDYTDAAPNISNHAEVNLAALCLAPESGDTGWIVYKRKDPALQEDRGDSLDFAYLLALISRSRTIAIHLEGDLWCTGRIDIKGSDLPFLNAVDFTGFQWKLEAFLAVDNPDTFFLVPASNILPTHEHLFREHKVTVVSLTQFQQLAMHEFPADKLILKVQGNELEFLVNLLFIDTEREFRTWRSVRTAKSRLPAVGIIP